MERLSFDAFGLRRNANGTDATAAITSSVGRVTLANDMPSAYRMLFGGLQPALVYQEIEARKKRGVTLNVTMYSGVVPRVVFHSTRATISEAKRVAYPPLS